MKKELNALAAIAEYSQILDKLIEIGNPFDERKAAIIRKHTDNEEYLEGEAYQKQQTDLFGVDGRSGYVRDLIKHIDTIE